MVEFIETQIAPKYKDHLIILDNARSHNNDMVREAILKSGVNIILFCTITTVDFISNII